jgi:hypothetical protein
MSFKNIQCFNYQYIGCALELAVWIAASVCVAASSLGTCTTFALALVLASTTVILYYKHNNCNSSLGLGCVHNRENVRWIM